MTTLEPSVLKGCYAVDLQTYVLGSETQTILAIRKVNALSKDHRILHFTPFVAYPGQVIFL